jgi:hypothetical protein
MEMENSYKQVITCVMSERESAISELGLRSPDGNAIGSSSASNEDTEESEDQNSTSTSLGCTSPVAIAIAEAD